MTVDQIMTRPVTSIGMDTSIREVQGLFAEHRFHHLLVVDNGELVGVISDRDLLRNQSPFIGKASERPQDLATLNRRVHQIMTRKPVTVTPDTELEDAARLMIEQRVSCLPVMQDKHRVAGIVTWRDLVAGLCGIAAE